MLEWKHTKTPVPYPEALAAMEARVEAIRKEGAEEMVWLLEHPPLYTAGTSAREGDLLRSDRFPVYETGRGGQYTYHGPGQRVAYVMLDIAARYGTDVRKFVQELERWIILTLAELGVVGEVKEGRIGVWVQTPAGEKKIAALGIRVRRGVSYHGIAINAHPDLNHFSGIVPCGIREYGVTSLKELGRPHDLAGLDAVLMRSFAQVFA